MKNPFGQIVSFEDYVDIIGIPKEQLNSEEVKNRINKWLVQATEQFDSMISGNGQLGRLYRWFEKLEDNEEDNYKKYKLIKAICSWVETFVIKGKFWVDGLPVINSNVDIQINSSSNDSNVEAKRKDIIQDLVSVGLYQTTNFGDNGTFQDNQQNAEQLIEDLIVLSTSELQQNYLKLNPQKSLEGNLDFANNDLVNGGNIIGSTQHARNNIQYYNIIDSTIDLNKNTVIGSLPLDPTQVEAFNQSQQEQDVKIEENKNNIQTNTTNIQANKNTIDRVDNDLTNLDSEVLGLINRTTQIENNYLNKNITQLQQVRGNVDFQGDLIIKRKGYVDVIDPQANTSMVNIQHLNNTINPINTKLTSTTNLLNQTIDGLRTLKPFQYVGEYQNGTSYNINQLVSYNNNLYLSKEDNNNTTPPSDKWLLINKDTISVDLSNYPTKLEVEQIKTTLENNITSNTNNITTITQEVNTNKNNITNLATVQNQHDQLIQQNKTNTTSNTTSITNLENKYTQLNDSVVKIAGQQIITGKKIFTGPGEGIQIRPNATNGSSYITGYDLDGKIKKWVLGNTGKNEGMLLEAPQGNIYLKPSASNNGYIDCYNTRISRIANPTANTDAANKQYVDNAIKNANLGGGAGSGGNIPQETLNQIETNKNNITDLTNKTNTIEQNYLSKNSNVLQIVKGSVDFYKNVVVKQKGFVDQIDPNINTSMVNIQYVKNNTTLLTTDQTINGTKTFTNQIVANGGLKTAASQTITSGNLEVGSGSTFAYMTSDDDRAKSLKFSGLSGRGKLDLDMGSASKITNLPDPINNQDAATKYYVDNKVFKSISESSMLYKSPDNMKYKNIDKINVSLFNKNNIDYYNPLIITFDRYNNAGKYQGTFTFPVQQNIHSPNVGNPSYGCYTQMYYNESTTHMEQGAMIGLRITNSYIEVSCWDQNDRIGNIIIYGKTLSEI